MTEPASASGLTLAAGVGMASLLPFVNGDALIGAILGASIVALKTKDTIWYLKIFGFILSTLCGYYFAPDAQVLINKLLSNIIGFQIRSIAVIGCLVAIVILPFLQKLMDYANSFNLEKAIDSILNRSKSKSKDE